MKAWLPRRLIVGLAAMGALIAAWVATALWLKLGGNFGEWQPALSLRAPGPEALWGYALYGQPVAELLFRGAGAVLLFGSLAVALSVGIALVAGFYLATGSAGSRGRALLNYLLDVCGAAPGFLLAAAVLYAGGPSPWSLAAAFALSNWDSSTRLAWSVGNLVVHRPAYLADTALGYTAPKLFVAHYLPETFGPLSSRFCSLLAFFIVFGTSSVVIGILDAEFFPWGALLNQGRHYFDVAPHVFWAGWLLIFVSTLSLTLISSGIHRLFERKIPR